MRLPMYEVRRRQTGSAYVRCTMYDVRFGKFARVARDAERMQSGILKALRGRGYKGTEAPGGAYVRWTLYDCEVRAR